MLVKNFTFVLLAIFAISCSAKNKPLDNQAPQVLNQQPEASNVVHFSYDNYKLTKKAQRDLLQIIPSLKENNQAPIFIEGHYDERGTEEYNLKLGKNRANAVKKFLVKNEINAKRIKTISYGESRPVDSGHDEDSWAKNRRAVTIVAR